MESGESTSLSRRERHLAVKDASWFSQFQNGSNPWLARYVYALMFLLANLLAWAARDYGSHGVLSEMQRLRLCAGASDCLGTDGVLRVSLGCFIFFIVMFLSTAGTSKFHDPRDSWSWHSGWWLLKILLWVGLTMITFFVPSTIIQIYGEIAHFGAGRIHVMLVATTAYVVCLVGIILMYIWYVA